MEVPVPALKLALTRNFHQYADRLRLRIQIIEQYPLPCGEPQRARLDDRSLTLDSESMTHHAGLGR